VFNKLIDLHNRDVSFKKKKDDDTLWNGSEEYRNVGSWCEEDGDSD